jgi:hypothetical protein
MTPRSSTHRSSCANAGTVQFSRARHRATATDPVRMTRGVVMDGRFDSATRSLVRKEDGIAIRERPSAEFAPAIRPSRARIAPMSSRAAFSEAPELLGRRPHRCFARFGYPFQPQMHDDRCEFALKLLLCELQCSINCVHVCSCYPTFCLALIVASPARRATLVLDTDFRLMKSAVRILPPRKKSPHRSLLAAAAGKRRIHSHGLRPARLNGPCRQGRVGLLVCLTHEGDCHGKEKSEKEIR